MSATVARPNAVPPSGGSGRAIALAIVMHLLLGGLLFFGIRWQSSPPAVVQAELWSAVPQTAAPAPRPVPPPPKVEAPRPEVEPEPEPEPPKLKVDIAEKAPVKKVEPPKKKEPVKVVEPPKPQVRPAPPPTPVAKAKPEPVKAPPKPVAETPRRPSALESLLAAADSESTKPSTGKDAQTSGPRGDQNGYTAKLQAAIRSQMRYPATASGNPFVKVRIEQLPNGEVLNVTILKASGVQAFDDAVERAIQAASPLPRPAQGQPPRELELTYNMYDKS